MSTLSFRRVFFISGLMVLVIVYAVLWVKMIASPAERTGSDFIAFYAAGRVAQEYGTANVYNIDLQQAVQQEQVGFELVPGQVLLYNHVPFLIPILLVLVNGNYVASFLRWALLLLGIFVLGTGILAFLLRRSGWDRAGVWIAAAGMLAFFPLFISLMNGQDTAFTFFGLCLFVAGLLTGRDWLAGFGLALATVRPQVSVLLAVPFLFRRQKIFAWFCLGTAILSLFSLFILGVEGARAFLDLLMVSAGGVWYGLHESAMVDMVGLLFRLIPGLGGDAIRLIGWVFYGLALVGLCVLWSRSWEIAEKQIGLAVTLAVFVSPHLHYHDLALLLVALVAALLVLVKGNYIRAQTAALAPLLVSLSMLFASLIPALHYNFPYLVMLVLVLTLWFPGKILHPAGLPVNT